MTSVNNFKSVVLSWQAFLTYSVGILIGILAVQLLPVTIDIHLRTQEKGYLQYYYNTGSGFNESQSERLQLSGSADFSHYIASTRARGLKAIRIDPVETPGEFEILGMQINYFLWHRQWQGSSELKVLIPVHEVELVSMGDAMLSGRATGIDSGIAITDLIELKRWQQITTIIGAVLGGAIAYLWQFLIRYFGGLRAIVANRYAPILMIVTIGSLLRIFYWSQSGLPSEPSQLWATWPDEGTYFSIAQYIMTHGLRDYFLAEQSVMAAPMNPMYIALIYSVFDSVAAIRAVNILLSVVSIVLVYKLGKRVFSKSVGLLAAGICAVHGQLIQYSATLLTEPLFLCFFIGGIYALVLTLETLNFSRSRYLKYALGSALILTMMMLTRSIAMLLPVFLLAAVGSREAYRSYRVGTPSFPLLKRAALPLLLPVLIVGIVATKNYAFFDRFMVATGSGAALWLGSRADTEGDEPPYRGRTYDTQVVTQAASHLSIQGDTLLTEAAKKNIQANPSGYAWWNVKKVGRLLVGSNLAWFYPYKNITDWYRASGRNAVSTANILFQIILASCIAVYGVFGLIAARGQESFGVVISASVCYLIIFSVPFLVIQRYGLPLVMLLVIPASAVMYGAWHAGGRLRRGALFGVPFALAIVFQVLFSG